MANWSLEQVESKRQRREFLAVGRSLYAGNPHFVAPLDSDIESVFDPSRNKMFRDGEAVRWILRSDQGLVVGRIAAFYNRSQAAMESQPTGGCGFFECIAAQEAANMLFDAARKWLASKGMKAMDGPVNFGSRDMWWGLLVEGFDIDPLYGNPYNPPYYRQLFENYGFCNYFNQTTYAQKLDPKVVNPVVSARLQRLKADPDYSFRNIVGDDLNALPERFRAIYNRGWQNFTGVKPLSQVEVKSLFKSLRPIIDRRLIYFAYHRERPIGFFVMIPDLNRIIKSFNGRFGLARQLKLLWKLRHGGCDRIFAMVFGVDPDYQGRGIESGMIMAFGDCVQSQKLPYTSMELAWIGDFNPVMMRMVELYVQAGKIKMHTTYRYQFDRTQPFSRCPKLRPVKQNNQQ